ncbi:type IV secretion protein Rhs [Nonomuraea sp. NBC_00507]|uniref:RHS repeat-associated core domain-containing protein n=1 Tax=Nonomuraea sp. NBC_00507 TaxID=2976002 RepID=UPI002E18CF93
MPGHDAVAGKAPADPTAGDDMADPASANWPDTKSAEVTVPDSTASFAKAQGMPFSVARAIGINGTASPGRVRVDLLDRAAVPRRGLAMRVSAVDGTGPVQVRVDYKAFADLYGGGWASRLRLAAQNGSSWTELATANDRSAGTLTAQVDATEAGTLVALAAAPSSGGGNYAATPLQASATWTAGGNSGDFSWSYPLRMPPSLGGPVPGVSLSYSAQTSDGRTAASNNQPSWIGEGFDYQPGSISRSYKACADDGQSGVGDLCWGSDNATLTLSGHGGELIPVSADVWRLRNDDGTQVQRLTGAANGDENGEYWKVTTTDGTQYFFGLNRLPGWTDGKPVTNSAWTVPVFGNNAGEPCNKSSFASSYCTQANQWNLDYVVDPHGNSMSLWYATETNNYARNRTDGSVSGYVRGGWLTRIDYGTRQDGGVDSALTGTAPQRVVFAVQDRCVTQGATCVRSNTANWPDVPWDQQCDSTTSCPGIYSPAFFSQKMLSTVTTQVAAGSSYRDVEVWTLNHLFKDPGDGREKILWLDGIAHAGKVGTTTTVPDIRFNGVQMSNRVDTSTTKNPIVRYRISSIVDEFGAVTSVTYSRAECVLGSNMPALPDSNTKRCYPVWWTPYGTTTPTFDWFHKYVVTQVTVTDLAGGGSPAVVSSYRYLDSPAWHHDEGEFVPDAHKSWGQWRGYGKVRVIQGADGTTQSQTDAVYFRGMNGDKLASGTRSVTIPADPTFGGSPINDEPWRQGQVRETISYNGVGDSAPVLAKTLTEPWDHGPNASRTRGGITVSAYTTGVKSTTVKTALDSVRGWRTTKTTNTFDHDAGAPNPTGRIVMVDDAGDTALTTDDRCTRTSYASNAGAWMLTYPVEVETVAVACGTTPDRSKDVLSDVRTYYDGATAFGTTISKADVTRTERLADRSSGSPVYSQVSKASHDANGRVLESYDALNRRTSTTYNPASAAPVTTTAVTNPMRWAPATTIVEPTWGTPLSVVDANGRRTDLAYDGLGRLTAVWLPGRDKATQSANQTFAYTMRGTDGPSAVTTGTLNTTGTGYLTSYTLYDSLLRVRQTQRPAPGGGRIITDILYDSRGNAVQNNQDYYNAASPGSTLFLPTYAAPGRTLTTYDNAGRPTASIFQVDGVERWRTTSTYGGDHIDVNVPAGDVATSTWTDVRGNTTLLRQYHGNTVSGAYDTTRYSYTPDGLLASLTDPAGNVWRYDYDQRRRKKSEDDPDKGHIAYTYDDADQLISTTDARNTTLINAYDALGRKTAAYQGTVAPANQLAAWTYDTLADGTSVKGHPVKNIRYVGGATGSAYVSQVTGYDAAYRATQVVLTIPAAEGALAGNYITSTTYNANGSVATSTLPAAGGLPAETLTNTYNDVGLAATLTGLSSYVTQAHYDSLGHMGTLLLSDGGGKTLSQVWDYEAGTNRATEHGVFDEDTAIVYQDAWYAYDDSGNVTSIKDKTDQYGAGPDDNQCYGYDYLRRLTEAWTPGNGDCAAAPSTSGLGGPAPYWQSWTYDIVGSRLSQKDHTSGGTTTRTYTYPAPGAAQPHTATKVVTTPPTGTATSDTYSYDASGNAKTRNLVGKPGQTLTWNAEGKIASIADSGGTTSYIYDADGARLLAKDPRGTTLYLPSQEIRLTGTSTTATRYYGANAARTTTGGLIWTTNDYQNTNGITFTAATLTKSQRRTTPFGAVRGTTPSWPTTKGFVGGRTDPTGLTHLGAREYDANLGRFISDDPISDQSDPQQLHGYAYSHNNPTSYSDPSGLKDIEGDECAYGGCGSMPVDPTNSSGSGTGGTTTTGCIGKTPSSRSASCPPAPTPSKGPFRCDITCAEKRLQNEDWFNFQGRLQYDYECDAKQRLDGICVSRDTFTITEDPEWDDHGLIPDLQFGMGVNAAGKEAGTSIGEKSVTVSQSENYALTIEADVKGIDISGSVEWGTSLSDTTTVYMEADGLHNMAYLSPTIRTKWVRYERQTTLADGSQRVTLGYALKAEIYGWGYSYSDGSPKQGDSLRAMFGVKELPRYP